MSAIPCLRISLTALLGFLAWSSPNPALALEADLILRNGAVYTMDASRSWTQAVAVAGSRILAVGTNEEIDKLKGPSTRVIELDKKMVLPGFHDSHVHPATSILEEAGCNLKDLESQQALLASIKKYSEGHPGSGWIQGSGWSLPLFPGANPNKLELDRVTGDRPAILYSQDAHSAWVNSAALKVAGIDRCTKDPPGGRIERDAQSGEPTGTLREAAIHLVARHAPRPTPDQYREAVLAAQARLNQLGITSIQEAAAGQELLEAYSSVADRLTVRVHAAMVVNPEDGAGQIERLKQWRSLYRQSGFQPVAAKIFADGVIEARTAALLEPYEKNGKPTDQRGTLNFAPDTLYEVVSKLIAAGFQVHAHTIGDRAVRVMLDAIEKSSTSGGDKALRHHLAHLELVSPEDIPRFRQLGVTATFQPYWAFKDKYVTELTEPVLGPERSRRLYPIGSLFRSGAHVASGSDWNVTSLNPLDAIEVALTRRAPGELEGEPLAPDERVWLPEILAAYTINGAYLSGVEKETGSLEKGKSADLIVISKNLFAVEPPEIHNAKVLLTVFCGQTVYEDPSLSKGQANRQSSGFDSTCGAPPMDP